MPPSEIAGFEWFMDPAAARYVGGSNYWTSDKLRDVIDRILRGEIRREPSPLGLAKGLEYADVEGHEFTLSINYDSRAMVILNIRFYEDML